MYILLTDTHKQIDEVMSIQMNNNLVDVNKKQYSLSSLVLLFSLMYVRIYMISIIRYAYVVVLDDDDEMPQA